MKRKKLVFLIVILVLISVLGIFFALRISRSSKPVQPKVVEPKKEAPEITARPFFLLTPRSDGKAVIIKVTKIPKDAKIDYEITYLTDGVTQGIIGQVVPAQGENFYEREHIFGTCSKNVCKYDRNVEFGEWKANIQTSENIYETGSNFHLQKIDSVGGRIELANKFTIDVTKGGFKKSTWTISYENNSLPSALPTGLRLQAGPFSVGSSNSLNLQSKLVIALSQIPLNTNIKILYWDPIKNVWADLGGDVNQEEKTITSKIDSLGTFVVVSASL